MTVRRPFYGLIKATGIVGLALTMVCSLLFVFGGLAKPVEAAPLWTPVTNPINVDTIWTLAGSPYTVSGVVNVTAKLVINPGVEVRFNHQTPGSQLYFGVGGQLVAIGTPAQPITFTSNEPSPSPGDWDGLIFSASALSSTVQYAVIEYAREGLHLASFVTFNILSNTLRYNGQGGLEGAITGSPDNSTISFNKVYSSWGGLIIDEVGGDVIQGNEMYSIENDCIDITSAGAPSSNNKVLNNTLYNCRGRGINLEGGLNIGGNNQVISNTIWNINQEAVRVSDQNNFRLWQNTVYSTALTNTVSAVYLYKVNGATLRNNYLFNNGAANVYEGALRVEDSDDDAWSFVLTGTRLLDNYGSGFLFTGTNRFSPQTIHSNAICVTDKYEIENLGPEAITAAGNWLGTNSPVVGEQITGTVTYSPYIQLTAVASPLVVPADGLSMAVITLTMHDGQGHTMPLGARQLQLTRTLGSLNDTSLDLNNSGIATTSIHSASVGRAVITVTEWCGQAVTTTVEFTATDVAVSKTAAITQVIPGQTVIYTIVYSNNNAAAATNIFITDTLPANMQVVSADIPPGFSRSFSGQDVIWTHPSLGGYVTGTITLVARLNSTAIASCGQRLTNTVVITTATVDSNPGNNRNEAGVNVICADVVNRKTGPGGDVSPGQTVTYTITFSNANQAPAANVVITDTLPTGTSYQADTGGYPRSGTNPVIWSIGSLAANAGPTSFQLVLSTTTGICGSDYLTNTINIGTDTPESDANNSAQSSSPPRVVCLPNLQVTKTDGVTGFVWAGNLITYTLRYTNAGYANAANVVLTETLPGYTSFVGPAGWLRVGATNLYTYQVGSLPFSGANTGSVQFIVRLTTTLPAAVTAITNTVVISGSQPDDNPADNQTLITTPVRSIPDVVVTKAALTAQAVPGGLVTYVITLTNPSDTAAHNVVITDTPPLSTTPAGPNIWAVPTLNPGQVVTFTMPITTGAEICAPTYPYTYLVNRVEAYAQEPERNSADNVFTTTGFVNPVNIVCHDLVITKTLAVPSISPGKPVVFTITYRNTGAYTASNVVITDALAANVVYVTDTITSTSPITWPLDAVGPGQGGVFTVSLKFICPIGASGYYSFPNTVTIAADPPDNPAGNMSTAYSNDFRCDRVDLVIVKNDGIGTPPDEPPLVYAGDIFTYTIVYNNAGGETATGVVITETLPLYTEFVGPSGGTGWFPIPGGYYVYYPGDLAPGQGGRLNFAVRVTNTLPATVTQVLNRVDIASQQTDVYTRDNVSREQTPVRAIPDLVVTKTVLYPPVVRPGDVITYRVTLANQGIGTATNVILTDFLPNYTGYVTDTSRLPHTGSSIIGWNMGDMPPGAPSISFTLTLTAGANICNVDWITNTIEAIATEPDRDDGNNRYSAVLPVGCRDVAITKTVNTPQVNPGFTVVFSLTYSNPGLVATTQTVVTDTLPGDITFVDSTPLPDPGPPGQNYTWTLGPLASGIIRTIILTGSVNDSDALCGQTLTNTTGIAAAFAAGSEPYLGNNTAARSVVVRCIPDLGVLKNDRIGVTSAGEPPFVQAGDVFTYSIYYGNAGRGTANGVVLTETLPYYTNFVGPVGANGWRQVGTTRQYTYAIGSLPAPYGGRIEFAVRVTPTLPSLMLGGYITNTVCIGSQSQELTTADNCSYENTPVTEGAEARLLVTKIAVPASGSVVYAGQPIFYEVFVANTGALTAYNVRLTDTLPLSYITFITASLSNGQQLYFTNPLTATLGDMPVGQVAVLHVGVVVNSGVTGVFTNTAYATANNLSAVQASNPVTHTAQTPPVLRVLKTAQPSGGQVERGQLITYTLAITNSGPGSATGVVITDALPLGVTFVNSSTSQGWVSGPNPLVARVGTLTLNQSTRFTFTVRVMDTAPSGQVITNVGWLDSDQTVISLTNQVSHTVIAPSLQITKTANPIGGSTVTPTQRLTYTVIARNNGPATAYNVRITDTLPLTAVNFITATLSTGDPVYRQSNILTASIPSLASASQVTMTVVVTVNTVISGTVFTNTAAVAANTLPVMGSLPVTYSVIAPLPPITSDIHISKTANLTQTTPGHLVLFTLTYAYSGTTAASNVVITDTLPVGMDFVSSMPSPNLSDTVRHVYTWTWPSLPAGISQTILITANVQTGVVSGTVLTNIAHITTTSPDGDSANNTAAASIRVVDGIDLFVMKSDNVNSPPENPHVHPGDVITYTISYLNLGNRPASNVVITETLPLSTTFLRPTGPLGWFQVGGGRDYTYLIEPVDIAHGGVITFVVQVLTPTTSYISNTVCIAGAEEDVVPGNNCWLVVTPVITTPPLTSVLTLTKTANPTGGTAVQPGQTLTYTVVVSNNTGAPINNARITDTLPLTAVNFITATLNTGGTVYRQNNTLTTTIAALAVGSRVTMTVVVTVNTIITGTVFTNTATASADTVAVLTATVTHIVTGTMPITSGLSIVKLATPVGQVHAGQTLTYTVIVSNNTGAAVNNARITDTLPVSYVTFMGADLSSGGVIVFISPTLTATLPSPLASGVPITLTVLVLVNNDAPVDAVFTNTAWASASGAPLVTATVTHRVITNTAVYLPIILKNYTPPSAILVWRDQNDDLVSEVDGSDPQAFAPDGRADGAFILTVNTGGAAKTVTTITLVSTQSAAWNTIPGDGVIVLGIFNGGTRLNNANGSINQSITGQVVVTLYASDDIGGSRFPPDTYDYTVYVTFSDGSMVSASARIPPPPPSNCGPYKILRVGNSPHGVAVDTDHHRVYVANYGSNSVSVVNTDNNTLLQTITGITKANGIAYDTARNIIWVTNQMNNQVTPIQANADATSFTVLPPIPVGSSPWGVAVDSTRRLVYVVNNLSNSVTVIDAVTRSVVGTVSQAAGQFNQPFHVAVNSNTGQAYVPNFGGHSVTVLAGAAVNKVIELYDSTQPYGVAVDELRNVTYVTTVNTHRIVIIGTNKTTGQPDELLNWAEFHRGWNPARPVPLRAIAVNTTMPSNPPVMEDGGHVWATTSTNDGSEFNQALLIPKGGISYFHSPVPCNEVSANPAEGIAVNPDTDRVYVTSGETSGWLTIFTDPVTPPLIYLDVDDNAITIEYAKQK